MDIGDNKERLAKLGLAIRDRRLACGLSQVDLALMIGSSKSHISSIENGRVNLNMETVFRLADALDSQEVRDLILF